MSETIVISYIFSYRKFDVLKPAFPTTATGDNIAIAVAFEKITTERNLSLSFQLWSSELYICSHEGLTLEMLDLQTLYGGNLHYRLSR